MRSGRANHRTTKRKFLRRHWRSASTPCSPKPTPGSRATARSRQMRRRPFLNDVSADMLLMAFRYALPRGTTAPSEVAAELTRHWGSLPEWMRHQIVRDVEGYPGDVGVWGG